MRKLKALGHRGSWFADVEGESLPCVHDQWKKSSRYTNPYARPGHTRYEKYVQGIREKGRVIVTKDDEEFRRTGYIAIYEVDDVQFDEDGLRFRFTNKVADLI